ncbi:ABC transporter ATP-binding protein [Bacillus dakarensis]|uniref:ABC transporter ATP-binding protein n=1 Tax=Robertmurraya dakarensis TaxID=1926278 RepID=UPI000981A5EA|nr:dipeptide ABC transporter ATP-binding protein [Bacillus dakarensis]
MNNTLLKVKDLKKHYPIKKGILGGEIGAIKAVDGVSFEVKRGETFSIVGESGCGKTTTGMCLNNLIEPTSGEIYFNDKQVSFRQKKDFQEVRKNMQVIFQDPYSSLNPKHSIQRIISEPLVINKMGTKSEIEDRVQSLIRLVGLDSYHLNRYPHELSGGQKQRVGIARALALNPDLIICDEPVSALDVSIQSQILNLFEELQEKFNLTYIFISHDLSVVEHISDRVAVMYLGKIVEQGTREEIFNDPKHPYTQALLSSVPVAKPKSKNNRTRIVLEGDPPSPQNPPSGCHFHERCPVKIEACKKAYPDMREVNNLHKVACHLVSENLSITTQ